MLLKAPTTISFLIFSSATVVMSDSYKYKLRLRTCDVADAGGKFRLMGYAGGSDHTLDRSETLSIEWTSDKKIWAELNSGLLIISDSDEDICLSYNRIGMETSDGSYYDLRWHYSTNVWLAQRDSAKYEDCYSDAYWDDFNNHASNAYEYKVCESDDFPMYENMWLGGCSLRFENYITPDQDERYDGGYSLFFYDSLNCAPFCGAYCNGNADAPNSWNPWDELGNDFECDSSCPTDKPGFNGNTRRLGSASSLVECLGDDDCPNGSSCMCNDDNTEETKKLLLLEGNEGSWCRCLAVHEELV